MKITAQNRFVGDIGSLGEGRADPAMVLNL
jgi:hypothetical protein